MPQFDYFLIRELTSASSGRVPSSSGGYDIDNTMVPLCWTDQVHREEVKVIEARTPRGNNTRGVRCEMYCKLSLISVHYDLELHQG